MQVFISVPGENVRHDWPSLVVDSSRVGEFVSSSTLVETIQALEAQVQSCGAETRLLLRPEIIGGERGREYLRERAPECLAHIFVGPPHRLKYLKGLDNLLCTCPPKSAAEAGTVRDEFSFNPLRLSNLVATFNGFWLGRFLENPPDVGHQLFLPRGLRVSEARRSSRPLPDNLPITTLHLNNHDAHQSANIMLSKVTTAGAYAAGRGKDQRGIATFLGIIDVHDELPTGLAPIVRDLCYLSAAEASFRCILAITGAATLDLATLELVARRLNRSLELANFHRTILQSDAITLMAVQPEHYLDVFNLSDHILLTDDTWPDSEPVQIALLAGLKPVMLDSSPGFLAQSFQTNAIILPSERRRWGKDDHASMLMGSYPAPGKVRLLINSAGRVAASERRQNGKIFRTILLNSRREFARLLGMPDREALS